MERQPSQTASIAHGLDTHRASSRLYLFPCYDLFGPSSPNEISRAGRSPSQTRNELLIRKTLIAHVQKSLQVTITNLERKRCVIKCFRGG